MNMQFNFKSVRAALANNKDGLPLGANPLIHGLENSEVLAAEFDILNSDGKLLAQAEDGQYFTVDAAGKFNSDKPQVVAAYKRKSLVLDLTVPACLATLEGTTIEKSLVEAAVMKLVADYCKGQFIDNFEAIGAHDLETIAAAQAATGRSGAFSFEPSTLEEACESLRTYFIATVKNMELANIVASAAKQRFSRSAVARGFGAQDEAFFQRLQARLDAWAGWVAENAAENSDSFAPVYQCWSAGIDKVLNANSKVDFSALI
jgi:hypothetical protein